MRFTYLQELRRVVLVLGLMHGMLKAKFSLFKVLLTKYSLFKYNI